MSRPEMLKAILELRERERFVLNLNFKFSKQQQHIAPTDYFKEEHIPSGGLIAIMATERLTPTYTLRLCLTRRLVPPPAKSSSI